MDIVERLRYEPAMTGLQDEAADEIVSQRKQIEALQAQVGVLKEAFKNVLPWVVTQTVACHGMKCRELVCLSCTEETEAEQNAQEACDRYREAKQAIATTPESALSEVRRAERERVEKMICHELFDSTLRRNLITKLRAMGDK